MAVKRCLSMSHTQITCQLLLGFILIFQRVSLSQFHGTPPGYCPGWNFTRSEHDIVSASFQVLAFDSEGVLDISCTNYFKIDGIFFLQWALHCRNTGVPKDMTNLPCYLLFIYYILILFVEEYMWGITWGSVIDQSAKWEAIFFSFLRPVLKCSVS